MTKRCESCQQEKEMSVEEYMADRMFIYKAAHALFQDLYNSNGGGRDEDDGDNSAASLEPVDVLHLAVFLAGDDFNGS